MRKIILGLVSLVCLVSFSSAQESAPPASSPPASSPPPSSGQGQGQGQQGQGAGQGAQPPTSGNNNNNPVYLRGGTNSDILQRQQRQQDFLRLQMMELTMGNRDLFPEKTRRDIETLYRKTNKKEAKLLAVNDNEKQKYSFLLQDENAGIIKLISDLGCSVDTKVLVVKEECLKYSMPGAGSSYSFRTEDYRIPQLADLTFFDDTFEAGGILLHGIFTGIGNVELDKVTLQTPGVNYIAEIKPIKKQEDAEVFHKQLSKGIFKDGYFYGNRIKAIENMTYVLRSIAYEGEIYKSVNGVTYNELGFDKRKDIIVAFRIVKKDEDGSITLLWRELQRQSAPKMILKKKEKKESKEEKIAAKN